MILVTGGTGLVGSHLIVSLIDKGCSVRALKRQHSDLSVFETYLARPDVVSRVEWVTGDILDIYSMADAMQGVDTVYHCAAIVSFAPSIYDQMMHNNVEGTANVVNAAIDAGVKKLCYVSSIAAIGRSEDGLVITENAEWKPSAENSNYAVSKYNAEREVWRGTIEGLPAIIVNPGIILGPANWKHGSAALFSKVWNGLKFYTKGTNGFVDVRDVVQCMIQLTESEQENQRYILVADNYSYQYIFQEMAHQLGKPAPDIEASSFLTQLAWRLEAIRCFFTGSQPLITKETARTFSKAYLYSNNKIKEAIDVEFRPINEAISHTAKVFKALMHWK